MTQVTDAPTYSPTGNHGDKNMPTFDFHCPANGQTVEVMLKLHETLSTWGELCARKDCHSAIRRLMRPSRSSSRGPS